MPNLHFATYDRNRNHKPNLIRNPWVFFYRKGDRGGENGMYTAWDYYGEMDLEGIWPWIKEHSVVLKEYA